MLRSIPAVANVRALTWKRGESGKNKAIFCRILAKEPHAKTLRRKGRAAVYSNRFKGACPVNSPDGQAHYSGGFVGPVLGNGEGVPGVPLREKSGTRVALATQAKDG